jgi:glycosyltransferase involved in cell wall biosynthesis
VLLSLVIPTYNRARLLPETIPALKRLRVAEGIAYEVIFVDNGSTDSTQSILEEVARREPERFRYIRNPPTGGPSSPRNRGIRAAKGEAVVIIDDDVVPDDDLVLQYAAFHARYPEQHHAAVGVAYVPERLQEDPMSWLHTFNYAGIQDPDRVSYLYFWTCNVSVKREFMLSAGMFDEAFLCAEDVMCGYKLAQNGMHLHFCPEARGQHLHQMTPLALPARGRFVGRWQYRFLERTGWDLDALILNRVLSTRLPLWILIKRIAGRIAFRILDNPLTMWLLERLGARRSKRNRITDIYYRFVYYRNFLAGFYEAKAMSDR